MDALPDLYHKNVDIWIDADGVYPHQMLARNPDGTLELFALAFQTPRQVMAAVFAEWLKDKSRELIYSLDRFAKAGQGTELADLLAGAWWNGTLWKPFIIEYRHKPRLVKPLQWSNVFWNEVIQRELVIFRS